MKFAASRYDRLLRGFLSDPFHPVLVRRAIDRFLGDLERDDLVYRPDVVTTVCDFCSGMVQHTGRFAGKPLELLPYQVFLIANVYGLFRRDGARKYSEALLAIPRKNGKSSLLAALALYGLFEENGARVFIAAQSFDQASLLFDTAVSFSRNTPQLASVLHPFNSANNKIIKHEFGQITPIHAESKTLDGLNPSMVVYDEFFTTRGSELYSVLSTGLGARDFPLMILIGSHSTMLDGFGVTFEANIRSALLGNGSLLDHQFALIFEPDPTDDLHDAATWQKVNPAWGVILSPNWFKTEYEKALQDDATWAQFCAKNLNYYPRQNTESWIPHKTLHSVPTVKSLKSNQKVVLAFDLSVRNDLTACAIIGLEDRVMQWFFWTPAPTVKARQRLEHPDWGRWVQQGYAIAQDRDFINVREVWDVVRTYLSSLSLTPVVIAYDRFKAEDLKEVVAAEGLGETLYDFPQWRKHMNPAIRAFIQACYEQSVRFVPNPLAMLNLESAVLDTDNSGAYMLVKPQKRSARVHIDGAIVAVMAYQAARLYDAQLIGGTNSKEEFLPYV